MDADDACRPCSIDGTATLTIVTSSSDMKPTSSVTARARHRLRWASEECCGAESRWGLDIGVFGYPAGTSGNYNEDEADCTWLTNRRWHCSAPGSWASAW